MARSEKEAWRKVLSVAATLPLGGKRDALMELAADMLDQVAQGVHTNPRFAKNPGLVIWPNPPGGARRNPLPATSVRAEEKLSPRVYEIGYKHEEDGQKYKHEFAPGVEMWLVMMGGRQAVVVFGTHGQDVFGDF